MEKTIRFSISLESELSRKFDSWMKKNSYKNRSEAVRDLIRDKLVEEEWKDDSKEVVAVLSLVYSHDSPELPRVLTDIQHQHHSLVISSTHIHLDKHNCLEVIIMKGQVGVIKKVASELLSLRRVKHGRLMMTTTGADIPS
ncbi:MAG TPA: nickel-responsive transcriptional regulator NikR [Candidatus Saccharicenans sp.]|jgi:CopG family nickel-responsive transcriptional regulator|nr:nickel-responsive transcriptional regulator NikR [Candidatus Saccharicenans sp.]HOJ27265.1 nickel-responsive transcriptional regulator NikR [Candidatus Saccharicenans sp.]HOL46515.1 nickel-responsive transcriptional regulator NikR [Candidatus Saccharicenans sp.]HOM95131.1 nickel-responsive transcriptional regulator NikR [Candidatus Saccharicenans sp.]HOT69597.1 nickel-responsive transcriptional regulator NikR [Candidatus Saccharicenans sp.]